MWDQSSSADALPLTQPLLRVLDMVGGRPAKVPSRQRACQRSTAPATNKENEIKNISGKAGMAEK